MKNIAVAVSDFDNPEVKKIISALYPKLNEKYNVTIIAYNGTICDEYEDNLVILDIPRTSKGIIPSFICEFKRIIALRKIAKEKNIRLFVSLSEEANCAVAYSFIPVKKSIYCSSHSDYKINGKKYSKMLKYADAILIKGKSLGNIFKEEHPAFANKVKTVETPVDTQNIAELAKEPLPEEYISFYETKKVIAVSAPFTYEKAHWNILKAFNILKESLKDAGLVFIGSGGEYEEKIKAMADESEYKEDILFVGEQSNPYKYLANADVYAQADILDGGQYPLLEAMAANTPVIATDCMTSEILFAKHDPDFKCSKMTFADYGIITPSFDSKENYSYIASYSEHIDLANAMKEMILSEKIPDILKGKALKSLDRYSSEKILKTYIEFVDKLYLCL